MDTMLLPSISHCFFPEAMMIEPTENESKKTLDGFIDVMHTIAREARETPQEVFRSTTQYAYWTR